MKEGSTVRIDTMKAKQYAMQELYGKLPCPGCRDGFDLIST
jgi:hypothetical protein